MELTGGINVKRVDTGMVSPRTAWEVNLKGFSKGYYPVTQDALIVFTHNAASVQSIKWGEFYENN